MADLPQQGYIIAPIDWSGKVHKVTMATGALSMSGTLGPRPWTEKATITWTLPADEANALLEQFKADFFNVAYTYECNTRGTVRLRPTDTFSFTERQTGKRVTVSVTFERV